MHDLSLTDIKAFHADLLSVATAGIAMAGGPLTDPLEQRDHGWFGVSRSSANIESWRESLLTIEQRLAAASLDGRPVADALESEAGVAPNYLNAFHAWLASDRDPDSLNAWSMMALRGRRRLWRTRARWVQPLIWASVGYCGLMFISLGIAPQFLSFARQARISPGIALTTVLGIRAAAPVWGFLVPILVMAWAIALYGRNRPARLPHSAQRRSRLDVQADSGNVCRSEVGESSGLNTGVTGVLLGGLLALGIALCVFGPLVELLYDVATPVEVTHVGL